MPIPLPSSKKAIERRAAGSGGKRRVGPVVPGCSPLPHYSALPQHQPARPSFERLTSQPDLDEPHAEEDLSRSKPREHVEIAW